MVYIFDSDFDSERYDQATQRGLFELKKHTGCDRETDHVSPEFVTIQTRGEKLLIHLMRV